MRPRGLGWALAYVTCLSGAFGMAFALRSYTIEHTAMAGDRNRMLVISVWPQSADWMEAVAEKARVAAGLEGGGDEAPLVATILPPEYPMNDMYYALDRLKETGAATFGHREIQVAGFHGLDRAISIGPEPGPEDPVRVVLSRPSKAYRAHLEPSELLDPGVLPTPLAVVTLVPSAAGGERVEIPLPRNAWGPTVVMPRF